MTLTAAEHAQIRAQAEAIEARSGVEIVAAVIARADSYPEIPWKAFALGTALSSALLLALALLRPHALSGGEVLAVAAMVFGAGLSAALATVLLPPFARLWLDAARAETEVRQYAQALFVEHDLARTAERRALLVLVSEFERRVVVLPDRGLARIAPHEWAAVVAAMTPLLRAGQTGAALAAGLEAAAARLQAAGFTAAAADAIGAELLTPRSP